MTASAQPPPESSRSRFTIPFEVPAYWTPEQALAVVELLDDLRELIWAHYGVQLIELVQAERADTETETSHAVSTDEVDF
jgi:hypothetical protein